ncbi:hypothetical protein SAMN03159341_104315 [Paenibacillus sp. 1_12]|uniref:hypothetical protein n=1 Tax=Paenibacillus sp. 1_12 TaxID=1566278 RepID=UPI0008E76AF2|nr:hypothetical protein [Paenibacillus sp. 1_12]SFL26355.1 hypothetical protein SAMN03159341_104315 [Paenibacillus sp. 1_12]
MKVNRSLMTRTGFYTKVGTDMIGIYLSSEGPKMFINRETFDLQNPCWDVEMVMGKTNHLISFYWCGEVKLSVRCELENELFVSLYHYLGCRTNEQRLA